MRRGDMEMKKKIVRIYIFSLLTGAPATDHATINFFDRAHIRLRKKRYIDLSNEMPWLIYKYNLTEVPHMKTSSAM